MKISDLKAKSDRLSAEYANKQNELEDLKRQRALLDDRVNETAGSGDFESFKVADDALREVDQRIKFLEKNLSDENNFRISTAEISEAWNEYVSAHDAKFVKAWAAYEKSRKDTAEKFSDLVEAQYNALCMKRDLESFQDDNYQLPIKFKTIPLRDDLHDGVKLSWSYDAIILFADKKYNKLADAMKDYGVNSATPGQKMNVFLTAVLNAKDLRYGVMPKSI